MGDHVGILSVVLFALLDVGGCRLNYYFCLLWWVLRRYYDVLVVLVGLRRSGARYRYIDVYTCRIQSLIDDVRQSFLSMLLHVVIGSRGIGIRQRHILHFASTNTSSVQVYSL